VARPFKNPQLSALANKSGISVRCARKFYRQGMSKLAFKCLLNEIKRHDAKINHKKSHGNTSATEERAV